MKINVTRRDVILAAGGTAAGIALSPAPWKLLDDLSIWTQNWKWIPKARRGEITYRSTACALCPAGCALRARLVGEIPVSINAAGMSAASRAICSLGETAHHLPYHPARTTHPLHIIRRNGSRRAMPASMESVTANAVAAVKNATSRGQVVAVLDTRDDRSISWAWRNLVGQIPFAVAIAAPGRESATIDRLQSMTTTSSVTLDLETTRTVLSFGAPIGDGWASPRFASRFSGPAAGRPRLIHVEPVLSRTSELADLWLPVAPGTEGALALGIANVLLSERLVAVNSSDDFKAYQEVVARFTPDTVAKITGVRATDIIAAARALANAPAVVVSGGNSGNGGFSAETEAAIAGLNVLLGSIDVPGGFKRHSGLPQPFDATKSSPRTELGAIADGSIGVLFIDATDGEASLAWSAIERKLAPGATVVALSPFKSGIAQNASYVIPTAVFLENVREVITPIDSSSPSISIAPQIVRPADGSVDPAAFIRSLADALSLQLDGSWKSSEELLRARVDRVHSLNRGTVTSFDDGSSKSISEFASTDELYAALAAGARWQDDAINAPSAPVLLLGDLRDAFASLETAPVRTDGTRPLILVPHAFRDTSASSAVSPVLTKIHQESGLRHSSRVVRINPRTAQQYSVKNGAKARLETARGLMTVTVQYDQSVRPDVVEAAAGPDALALGTRNAVARAGILDLCTADEQGVWRLTYARLLEA